MRQPGLPLPELAMGSGHPEGHLVHLVEVQQSATLSVAQIQTESFTWPELETELQKTSPVPNR